MGLVNTVVPVDQLESETVKWCREMLRLSPTALRVLKAGFNAHQLVTSGLVTRRDDGTEIDRFRNRLMIPIARDTGTVIAFGGRALEAELRGAPLPARR